MLFVRIYICYCLLVKVVSQNGKDSLGSEDLCQHLSLGILVCPHLLDFGDWVAAAKKGEGLDLWLYKSQHEGSSHAGAKVGS